MPEHKIDEGLIDAAYKRRREVLKEYTLEQVLTKVHESIHDQLPMDAFLSKVEKLTAFNVAEGAKPVVAIDMCVEIINEIRAEQAKKKLWKHDGSVIVVPEADRNYVKVNNSHNPIGTLHRRIGGSAPVPWTTTPNLDELEFPVTVTLVLDLIVVPTGASV